MSEEDGTLQNQINVLKKQLSNCQNSSRVCLRGWRDCHDEAAKAAKAAKAGGGLKN